MKKFDHIAIIHKRLTGQLTVSEQLQLTEWLMDNPANKAVAQEVELIWAASASYQKEQTLDIEQGLSRFQEARKASAIEAIPVETKVKTLSIKRFLLRAAVAAGFFFGLFFLLQEMGQFGTDGLAVITTKSGQQENINLEDGSSVYINGATVFDYPSHFEANTRKVALEGEAFFQIAKEENRPFTIATNNLEIKVLGTSFNVYAYPDKATEEVAVATGKVAVSLKQNAEKYILEAGDKLIYHPAKDEVTISKDIQQNAQAWRTGTLTFKNTPLSEVCQVLKKHFDIDVQITNKTLAGCTFSAGVFKKATKEVVLETIETTFGLKVNKTGKKSYQLVGDSCH